MKMIEKLITGVFIVGFLFSCERQDNNLDKLSVTYSSDMECKVNGPLKSNNPAPESSCIKFSYNGDSLLTMMHYNAGFNCCPGNLTVDIKVKGDSLIVSENETEHGCKCNCLFNLETKIHNLPAGTYHIRYVEPYVKQPMAKLVFDLDLKKEPEGQVCVTRPEGWWQ